MMVVRARIPKPLCCALLAAAAAIATGCASAPPSASAGPAAAPTTTSTAGAPASASKLVRTADFTVKAERDGWNPEVRNGEVVYCKTDFPIGSRIPKRYCLNKTGVETQMLAEQRQREAMQRAGAAPNCTNAATC